jgi:hypothetical protein
MTRRIRLTLCLVVACLALGVGSGVAIAQAAAAKPFAPDQKVEVREGDEWSPATVVKKEGRKYQIKYEDGTDEWVTADRVRLPGAAGAKADGGAGKDDGEPAPAAKAKAPKEQFKNGAKVEVQSLSGWDKATIKNRDGDLYLVGVEGWDKEFFWKWMHVSSIRKPGSSKPGVSRVRSVTVGNSGIAKAKAEAKREFENIEEEVAADATRDPSASPFAPKPYDKPVIDSNLEKVEVLAPTDGADKLTKFDPAPAKPPKLSQQAYVLKGKGAWPAEGPAAVLLGGTRGVVSYQSGGASDSRTLKLELLDLANGKNLGFVKADPMSMPLALSPSGERLVGRQHGFHNGTKVRVDVFALGKGASTSEPKHVVSFVPYVSADFFWKDVEWAGFADDEHVMTINALGGDLVCWHAATATATWRMKVRTGTAPARSPGGKQLAVATDAGVAVIDPLAGKVLALAAGARPVKGLAFTPDGRRVVGTSGNTLSAWDLATGQALPDVGLPAGGAAGEPVALDGRFVLVGGTDLVDMDKKMVVWRYARPQGALGDVQQLGGRTWAVLLDNGRNVLAGAALPHAAAVKAADALDAAGAMLVKPGDAVALTVTIEGTADQQQKIKAAITEQLKQSGIRVDDAAPVKLIARTERGETREQTYERRGAGFGGPFNREAEKVAVTEKITRIFFESGGKVAWESRTSSGVPMFVTSQEGQTINAAVQAASQFNLAFLESVRVPAYVPLPTDAPGLGQSTWTMKGVADQPRPAPGARPAGDGGDGLD